ncbi:hypothetical protein Selin_0047 [Desulfurispirillum indicum S5]|uniref:Ferritin-like diiron domain-containing protein n=1 Tax=Desulfurispirillum indicum (strain ATCC BAA-1389 / DSM 22839 / S5) TaxID=653733 RepID=E6W4S8_DESIS|nr:hypothetical protein [Desulfurispirillum indicum]ADU64806.1 hypothetical protein Selin_0047 [Desulfurispirillum indicum S5]
MSTYRCNKCRMLSFSEPSPSTCPHCSYEDTFEEFNGETMDMEQYIKTQISGDSWEATRLMAYGLLAQQLGYPQVADVMGKLAEEELRHAAGFVQRDEDTTDKNDIMEMIKKLIEGKKGSRKLKLEGSSHARAAENPQMESWFRTCADDEKRHIKSLEWCLKQLQKL